MNPKKKAVMVGNLPPPFHGSSIYFMNLLNSRIRESFDVFHLDTSDHRSLENLSKLDYTNVLIALKSILKLRKLLKSENPDIVYIPVASNFLPYLRDGLFIITASAYSKAKIIIHLHEGNYFRNDFYEKSNFILKKFIDLSLRKVRTAIVLSSSFRSTFEGLVANIEVCPNGIKDEFKNPEQKISIEEVDKIVVSYLGNLLESKGVLDLLNAAVLVLKKITDIEFRFAGAWKENETKSEAERIVSENRISDRVKFCGVLSGADKTKFLEETDIFVFPTRYRHEGFPLAILEAMSAAIPVISTRNTGAIKEIVIDGETGILIREKNIPEIAGAILKLASDKELRQSMAGKARKKFLENYLFDKNINRIIEIFNDALV